LGRPVTPVSASRSQSSVVPLRGVAQMMQAPYLT
jgi:hypothetical protein